MAISYVGQATGTTSATLPTHTTGDLLLAFAYRDGSTTAPTVPTGWTTISSGTGGGGSSNSSALAYRVATASGTASGTWTNATGVSFHVYRGTHATTPIGIDGTSTGSTASVTYPALTLSNTSGSSWVVGFAGHRSVNTTLETAPTGMTNRSDYLDATNEVVGHDTNAGVTSWSSQSVSVGGTASNWITRTVEILISGTTHTGNASLSGAGSLSTSGAVTRPASASLSGTGAVSSTATNTKDGSASLSGTGSIAPNETKTAYTGYYKRITEDGNFRVTQDDTYRIQETISLIIIAADASLNGYGSLDVAGLLTKQAVSELTGTGLFSASATFIIPISPSFNGTGSLVASGDITRNASVTLDGFGTLLVTPDLTLNGISTLTGTGSVSVDGNVLQIGKIYAKQDGIWKLVTPYVKKEGVWEISEDVFVNNNTTWKQVYINDN